VIIEHFEKLPSSRPSSRRHVQTGEYSDPKDDEVVSTMSADKPVLLGAPSPHGSSKGKIARYGIVCLCDVCFSFLGIDSAKDDVY